MIHVIYHLARSCVDAGIRIIPGHRYEFGISNGDLVLQHDFVILVRVGAGHEAATA